VKINDANKTAQHKSFSIAKKELREPVLSPNDHGVCFDDDEFATIKANSDDEERAKEEVTSIMNKLSDREDIESDEEPIAKRQRFSDQKIGRDNLLLGLETSTCSEYEEDIDDQYSSSKEAKVTTAPIFTADVVYKIIKEDKFTHAFLKKKFFRYELLYVDHSYNQTFTYLRFKNETKAQRAMIEVEDISLIKVNGEEEVDYWKHVVACWADTRTMKSRHRVVSKRYKSNSRKKLLKRIDEHHEVLKEKNLKLF